MSFNSLVFLAFISLFFLIWPLVRQKRNIRFLFLVISSFVFYGWWDWRFLFLIVFSGLVDFFAASQIAKNEKRARLYLIISVLVNIASLAVFKYSVFVATQLDVLFHYVGLNTELKNNLPEFTYILPVGISFYTFQSMSYTIDVYRGKLKPTSNILHFFSYLVMFPQLVAGPIVRAKDFLRQLNQHRVVSGLQFWNGIKLVVIGYFQKTVLADNLGVFVDQAFAGATDGEGLYWWAVMLAFAFQIYFDFCGYSQIARGLAKLMGYHFKMNFNHPYLAVSMKNFWTRWHISLSTWFRDYVYIPLGGGRRGKLKAHRNMWLTMLLSGLWHGAALNFIFWGAYHAACLSVERIVTPYLNIKPLKIRKFLGWSATLFLVLIGWVFFRATSGLQIADILAKMFEINFEVNFVWQNLNPMIFLLLAIVFEAGYGVIRVRGWQRTLKQPLIEAFAFAILVASIVFLRGPEQEFIYFQF